jgi:hypothetical protein
MDFRHIAIRVSGDPLRDEFELKGSFYGVVPIDGDTPVNEAQTLNYKVTAAVQSRLRIFSQLLNLVLRQDSLKPWQEVDVALTSLATLLEGGGVVGALDVLRPEVEKVEGIAGRNDSCS